MSSTAPQMDHIARRMSAMDAALRKMRNYRLNEIEDEWGDFTNPTFDPIIQMIDAALSWEEAGYYPAKAEGR